MTKFLARSLVAIVALALCAQAGFAATSSKAAPAPHGNAASAGSDAAAVDGKSASHGASASRIMQIKTRGEEASAALRMKYEPRIAALSQQVDVESKGNPAEVSERLQKEFGLSRATLAQEQHAVGSAWGDLMIAHTLSAKPRHPISTMQVFQLHKEGMGWTQVAYGMGLDMVQVAAAIEAENRVAIGEAKPDGKVPAIGSGSGTSTSVNEAH